MMGNTKLSAIRDTVRQSFAMKDPELGAWFAEQLQRLEREAEANQTEIDTLRLLRDALIKETERARPKSRSRRTEAAPKTPSRPAASRRGK
jgi:hypothetical protein